MKNNINVNALVSLIKDFDYSMLNDAEWDEFKAIDPTNEAQLLKLFSQVTCLEYESMDSMSQTIIKGALSEALSSPDFNFNEVLDRVEMPFAPIREPRQFFLTLWKAIFKKSFM